VAIGLAVWIHADPLAALAGSDDLAEDVEAAEGDAVAALEGTISEEELGVVGGQANTLASDGHTRLYSKNRAVSEQRSNAHFRASEQTVMVRKSRR
jgi:hypothetical protein